MGAGRSRPLDTDPRCATLAPVWSPFVDAFVDTLHAGGAAVHPPPPRSGGRGSAASSSSPSASRLAAAHASRSPGAPGPVSRPAAARLVAIGDLHGDLGKARDAFRAGGLVDERGRWCGGSTVAVQVGDQLDRGGDEIAILYMLERLRKEARDAGGELIVMNGNHETLNAAGRFRYATSEGGEDFRRWRGRQLLGAAMKRACGEKPGQCTILGADAAADAVERGRRGYPIAPPPRPRGVPDPDPGRRTPPVGEANAAEEKNLGARMKKRRPAGPPAGSSALRLHAERAEGSWMPRLAALAPGGPIARRFLAHQPVVLQVGSTVFAHGGVLERHASYGLDRVNAETATWMRGGGGGGSSGSSHSSPSSSGGGGGGLHPPPAHVQGADSVVWTRAYSHPEPRRCDCGALEAALASVPGAARVVVGHTIQGPAGVNAACGGRAIRVDVGMSAGCGDAPAEVLEILDDGRGGMARMRWDPARGEAVREPVPGVG